MKKSEIRKRDEEWRKKVLERDSYKCIVCKKQPNKPHCHHIIPRAFKDLRWDVNNGVILCYYHHKGRFYSAHQNALWFCKFLFECCYKQYIYLINFLTKNEKKI